MSFSPLTSVIGAGVLSSNPAQPSSTLGKIANGEYTAASVAKDQKDAIKFGLAE